MKPIWQNDTELFALVKEKLFVALVGDILDQLGYHHQFLSPKLKPIKDHYILIGRAMTVLEADCYTDKSQSHNALSAEPFGNMFRALDDLKENEIYVCAGASHRYALWGGLMTTRALQCGAVGAVVHGFHRDTNEIEKLEFPVASFGSYAQDQSVRGKVLDWRVPIEFDGIRILDGDIIYGDRDGILVIPKAVETEVFQGALIKAESENKVKKALENGMPCQEAYEKFGVM